MRSLPCLGKWGRLTSAIATRCRGGFRDFGGRGRIVRFDIVTIFPEFFSGPLDYGIVRRARETKLIDVAVRDLREFAHDRHRTVDDRPFGGGAGMVLKPEPIFEAVESLVGSTVTPPRT